MWGARGGYVENPWTGTGQTEHRPSEAPANVDLRRSGQIEPREELRI